MQPDVMTSTTVAAAGRRRRGAASFVKPGPSRRAPAICVKQPGPPDRSSQLDSLSSHRLPCAALPFREVHGEHPILGVYTAHNWVDDRRRILEPAWHRKPVPRESDDLSHDTPPRPAPHRRPAARDTRGGQPAPPGRGFLGQPRLPRSTPARLADRAGCGCLPPWHSDSAAAGGRTTTRSPNESRSFRAVRDEKQSRGSRPVPSPIAHPRCARSIGHGGPESQGPPRVASVRAGRAGPRVAGTEAADPSGVRAENSTASVSKSLASLVHRHTVPS